MKSVKSLITLAALSGVALFAGCGGQNADGGASSTGNTPASDNGGSAADSGAKKLTIGYTPTIVLPQPLIGLDNGEYKKLAPEIEFEGKLFGAGSGVLEQLRAGTIDIGASGPFPALKAYAKSGDIVLLSGAATGGTELMVSKNGPIKSIKDLKGKVIGVNQPGSTVDSMVRYNLIKAGLKPDTDVRIVEVAPGEQSAELKRGEVAAVAAPAPWPSVVAATGDGRPLLDWKEILDNGTYSAGSFYTTKKFADANPELIKRFLEANKKITDRLNANRAKGDAEVLAAWEKVTTKKLDPVVAKVAFSTIKFTLDPDPKGLQRFADIAYETGALKKKAELAGFVYELP
jgi:NitT/TauT family transport system substrate-binding protein